MSRILLVDDSPHAQRMGERILSDEGFEVVTVSNADAALVRLEDVDPDVVVADTVMPGRTGYDICQYLKLSPRHRHVRVVLTAGVLETLDEEHSKRVEADATLRKPFEATALIALVKPLAEAAVTARAEAPGKPGAPNTVTAAPEQHTAPFIAVVDSEQVRAAVTVALDAAMGAMVDEISRRVLATLNKKKPDAHTLEQMSHPVAPKPAAPAPPAPLPSVTPAAAPKPAPMDPAPLAPPAARPVEPAPMRAEAVRRVSPLRLRSGSILGLDISRPEPSPPSGPDPDAESPAPEE